MALNWIEKHMVDYLRFGVLESFHLHMIHEIMNSPNGLLSSAIKYAVPLSDSFSIPDYVINSAIGAGDGRCCKYIILN